MLFGRNSLEIDTHPKANLSLSPIPALSNNAITVRPSGTASSYSAGPGTVHLNATALISLTSPAALAPSLNSTTAGTLFTTTALASIVPSVTTVRTPVPTQTSTFAAPTTISAAATSSPRTLGLKVPVAFATSSSSSDMAVSKSSPSPSPVTHSPSTSTSKAHTSSSPVAPSKPSKPAPPPPSSTTVNSSTHSSATPLSTQRAEPSLTPNSSASSPPVGSPVTNTASQVHTASSVPVTISETASDFVPTSTNGSQQTSAAHTSPSPSSSSKSSSGTTSHGTTTNTVKSDSSAPARTSSTALNAGKSEPVMSGPSSTTSLPSTSTSSSAASGGATIHSSEAISNNWDFFDNKKAVAGVFVVVSLALLAMIVGLVLYCRRVRTRRQRRSVAFQTISQPITTYRPTGSLHEGLMIDGERESSARHLMVSPSLKGSDVASVHRSASQSSHLSGDAHGPDTPVRAGIGALGLTGMRTHLDAAPMGRQMTQAYRYDGPFSDYHQIPPPVTNGFTRPFYPKPDSLAIGMAISGGPETTPNANKSRFPDERAPSPAPSTPSIYPPSLPVQQDTDESQFYEKEMRRPPVDVSVTRPLNLRVPQRVHFNELRREASVASDPFADPSPDSVDDLFYLETQTKVPPPKIDTRQLYRPGPLTPPDSASGDSSATTPYTTQSSDSDHDAKSNPFATAFLGRPVVGKIEPWARPPRSPLRNPSLSSRTGR